MNGVLRLVIWGLVFLAGPLLGQTPFLYYGGAFQAAAFAPEGLPNAGLPRGGIVTIFGRNLGPAAAVQADSFPLGTVLGGTALRIIQNGQTFDAYPLFVSAGQINAIIPSNAPLGRVSLRIVRGTAQSNPLPVEILPQNFGIFAINSAGYGPGIITNFVDSGNQPLNTTEQPAAPGQVITIWGTGLGAVSFADNVAPGAGNVGGPVEVFAGGKPATVLYHGRAPCCAGLDQIVARLPMDTPGGCWVPLQVRANGVVSNAVTMALAPPGQECSDPWSPLSEVVRKGGRLLRFLSLRGTYRGDIGFAQPFENLLDWGLLQVAEHAPNPFAYQVLDSLPPPGTCTVHTMRGHWLLDAVPIPVSSGTAIPVGNEVTVRAALQGALSRLSGFGRVYQALLGADGPLGSVSQPMYREGLQVQVSAPGAGDVPPFSVSTNPDLGFTWPGRDTNQRVTLTRSLTLQFPPGAPGDLVVAIGANTRLSRNASAFFVCTAHATAGSMAVPDYVLAALPADPARIGFPEGVIALGSTALSRATRFNVPGFRTAIAHHWQWSARSVVYR